MTSDRPRRLVAEAIGTMLLLAAVVGSGIMADRLSGGSTRARAGLAQIVSEVVATFGLLSVVWGCARTRPQAVAFAVGAYITAAYWFTSSTSFANPAVTLARAATDTFAGIRPLDVPGFLFGQIVGALAATLLFRWLVPTLPQVADRIVVPRETPPVERAGRA